jgi:hypothetical protein
MSAKSSAAARRPRSACPPTLRGAARRSHSPKALTVAVDPQLDILCNGELLGNEYSLDFVKRTRWTGRTDVLVLTYRYRDV